MLTGDPFCVERDRDCVGLAEVDSWIDALQPPCHPVTRLPGYPVTRLPIDGGAWIQGWHHGTHTGSASSTTRFGPGIAFQYSTGCG